MILNSEPRRKVEIDPQCHLLPRLPVLLLTVSACAAPAKNLGDPVVQCSSERVAFYTWLYRAVVNHIGGFLGFEHGSIQYSLSSCCLQFSSLLLALSARRKHVVSAVLRHKLLFG